MLNQHQRLPETQNVVESAVLDSIENIDADIELDFKLSTKTLMNIYGVVKTDSIPYIESHMLEYGINTKQRMAVFLAACFSMSCGFRRGAEKITLSAARLLKEYPDKVSNMKMAKNIVRCGEQEIANIIYSSIMGNGDINSNDGWQYRARTPLQFRGRLNYQMVSDRSGIDCISHPELLDAPENAMIAAMCYWQEHGFNKLADKLKFENLFELEVTLNKNTNTRNYRSNKGVTYIKKKISSDTSNLLDFCEFIERGMLYL